MNMRDFLLPLTLALLTTWAVQYFVFNRYAASPASTGTVQSGQTFVAPAHQVETRPLRREVDFIAQGDQAEQRTVIETPQALYTFSTGGASLTQLTFKRVADGKPILINTIEPQNAQARDTRTFLVALDTDTPYYYQLVNQRRVEGATQLRYRAQTPGAIIEKLFTVYDTKFQIDVDLTISPINQTIQARLLYAGPVMAQVKDDTISAVFNTEKGSLSKESFSKTDLNKGWLMPSVFGAEDKYFVHALVTDENRFAQRAYYALRDNQLIAILEAAPASSAASWHMAFYVGPKDEQAMAIVDPRLEQLLDYSGLLAPLSRLLLMILNYLYNFLHNYGWAIVMMTFLINLLLLPLNIKSARSMKKDAEFQKKLAYIQQRYKDDPDKLAHERAELMSKNGIPLLGGCLPKLLQFPIFIALNRVLSNSIQMYKAPFLWISDLSAKDPYYILPLGLFMGMIMQSTATEPKQRFTMIAVAMVVGAVATNFSAGLCLYILVGVLLMSIQTYVQSRWI